MHHTYIYHSYEVPSAFGKVKPFDSRSSLFLLHFSDEYSRLIVGPVDTFHLWHAIHPRVFIQNLLQHRMCMIERKLTTKFWNVDNEPRILASILHTFVGRLGVISFFLYKIFVETDFDIGFVYWMKISVK